MTETRSTTAEPNSGDVARAPRLPLVIVVLAQVQLSFNINALPVSIRPIVDELRTPATSIATALVIYSLFVAGLVMPGAKVGRIGGERLVFQLSVILHAVAMGMMAFSTDARTMNNAQALAGLAAALLVPTLVVLIATNYRGRQLAQALGVLAGAGPVAGALAFFVAGFLGTALSWRYSFGLLVFVAAVVIILSFRLKPVPRRSGVKIDLAGAALAATAVALVSFGFNNLNSWGLLLAEPAAPFGLLGLSPAPFMIVIGVVVGQAFFAWSRQRVADRRTPLLALEVLDSRYERSALFALLIVGGLGPAVNFLIPLYIQIVRDRDTFFTAVAVVPYTAAVAGSAIFIVRLYDRLNPRQIGIIGFILVAAGLISLAFTVRNEWGTPAVIVSLIVTGLGEGSLLTLVFNVMVACSPKELAGDVGALRGVANNLSTALGTAFASVVAVGLLSVFVTAGLNRSEVPDSLKAQVNLDNVNFVSDPHLEEVLEKTTATHEQAEKATRINQDARLHALKASFFILAGIALLAIFPASGLPRRMPGDAPESATPAREPEAVAAAPAA